MAANQDIDCTPKEKSLWCTYRCPIVVEKHQINIDYLDLNDICDDCRSYLFIGKRCIGKTTAIINILENLTQMKKIDNCIIVTHKNDDDNYKKICNKTYEISQLNMIFDNIMDTKQQLAPLKNDICDAPASQQLSTDNNKQTVLVIDSVADKFTHNRDLTNKLIYLMDHCKDYNIIIMLSAQYSRLIPPDMRRSVDCVFLFNEVYDPDIKHLYECYAGCFLSFSLFNDVFKTITNNRYTSLCIIRGTTETHFTQRVKYLVTNPYSTFSINPFICNDTHVSSLNEMGREKIIKTIDRILGQNDELIKMLKLLASEKC